MPMTRPLWLDERASIDTLRTLAEAESLERLRLTRRAPRAAPGAGHLSPRRWRAAALAALAVLGVIALYAVIVLQLAGRLPAVGTSDPFS